MRYGATYLSDTRATLLLIRELLVGSTPGVNGQCLGITDVGKVRNELEAVNDLTTSATTLDAKAKDTTESSLQVSLSCLVIRMALETRVGDPADIRALLEILC
jgi:hypothetical protein